MKVLKNILLSVGGNDLQPADIYFSRVIKEVRYRSGKLNWDDIAEKEKKRRITGKIPKATYPKTAEVIDGKWSLAIPGAIDAHVHFNTPGFEDREDFDHASFAAAVGGVTTVIDMPCTSIPPVTNVKNLKKKLTALKNRSYIDFAFWGGVRSEDIRSGIDVEKQIADLSAAGVVGFKVYVISGMPEFSDLTYDEILKTAAMIKATGKPMAVHAEDKTLITNKRKQLQNNGDNSWRAYCEARSVRAEAKAVAELMKTAEATGARIHIVHLSSQAGLKKIKLAQKNGFSVTAETCPHYLCFTQDDFHNAAIRNYLKTAPPVKFEKDKNALWKGLADGTISFVTTDHAGCNPRKEKISENFWEVYGGIPGVEHRVSFLFSEGFKKGKLSLEQTVRLLSINAAELYGLSSKGKISPGYDADFALINLWKEKTVKSRNMHSKGKFTPFENVIFSAVVEKTFLRGKQVVKDVFGGKFVKAKD